MPINEFRLPHSLQPRESLDDRKKKHEQRQAEMLWLRGQREREDGILKEWGYKPWKREDRRNRPLRTKTATVSYIARMREADVVRLRCTRGLTFREIGKQLEISHVAAWKRYRWATENFRLENDYRAKCFREIDDRLRRLGEVEATLSHLPPREREELLIERGLLPKPSKRRRSVRNHKG